MREGLSALLAACGLFTAITIMIIAIVMIAASLVDLPHILLLTLLMAANAGLFTASYFIGRGS